MEVYANNECQRRYIRVGIRPKKHGDPTHVSDNHFQAMLRRETFDVLQEQDPRDWKKANIGNMSLNTNLLSTPKHYLPYRKYHMGSCHSRNFLRLLYHQ